MRLRLRFPRRTSIIPNFVPAIDLVLASHRHKLTDMEFRDILRFLVKRFLLYLSFSSPLLVNYKSQDAVAMLGRR